MKFIKLIGEITWLFIKMLFDVIYQSTKQTIVYGLPIVALYVLFELIIKENQVKVLGIYVLTPLAALIAFTSLLYARARAVEGESQKVCVSSADKAFKACIYYSAAIVWGVVMATLVMIFQDSHIAFPKEVLKIFYIPSFFWIAFAYREIFQAICKIWPLLKN